MADAWQKDVSRHYPQCLSITRGEYVASIGIVHGVGDWQHYWEIVGSNGRTAAAGTAGSIDAAKRAAETALKELTE